MKKKFIFLPGDMELNIEDTSCPSNKTSNWRYAIMTFPTVDIIFYWTCFQKSEDMLQEKRKCSTDSAASWKKVQFGDSTSPIKLSFTFVKIIQFKIL